MTNLVSASILSADLLNLESEIRKLEENSVDWIHFDVMDGVFVPNISYGIPVLAQIRRKTEMFLDVHLMITNPLRYVTEFEKAGADMITFHIESESDTSETLRALQQTRCRTGIAIKPGTPAEAVFPYISHADMILVMTVEPGFGGQSFMDMSEKIRRIREYADLNGFGNLMIQVDGGIDDRTAPVVKSAGADVLVSGSYLFKAQDMGSAVGKLKE
ncbi:MAG: ribulose-phosphate 3-epimerase [Ruminococcus flavefaciens]|nr:ribulose-phosphate 3-epimerase [Ruminococcus flavefaciens]